MLTDHLDKYMYKWEEDDDIAITKEIYKVCLTNLQTDWHQAGIWSKDLQTHGRIDKWSINFMKEDHILTELKQD